MKVITVFLILEPLYIDTNGVSKASRGPLKRRICSLAALNKNTNFHCQVGKSSTSCGPCESAVGSRVEVLTPLGTRRILSATLLVAKNMSNSICLNSSLNLNSLFLPNCTVLFSS